MIFCALRFSVVAHGAKGEFFFGRCFRQAPNWLGYFALCALLVPMSAMLQLDGSYGHRACGVWHPLWGSIFE